MKRERLLEIGVEFKRSLVVTKNVILLILNGLFIQRNENVVILVGEFGGRGGAYTYFLQLFNFLKEKNLAVYVLLTPVEKKIISEDHDINEFDVIDIKPEIWRPEFRKKHGWLKNFQYLRIQLLELQFFLNINNRYKPKCFFFSICDPEHFLFELLLPNRIFYVLHTLTGDPLDKIKHKLLRRLTSKEKKIIVVSNFAKDLMIKNWRVGKPLQHNINVVYNFHHYPQTRSTNSLNSSKGQLLVLTLGSVVPYKNPILWCEMAKSVTNIVGGEKVRFIWLGDGSQLEECKKITLNYSNIHFPGFLTNVDQYYSSADIYVQPSYAESLGIAVLGAMAHKIPCVVSKVGGMTESILDGINGFVVEESDVEGFIQKVLLLIQDTELREELGNNGYRRFIETFSEQKWKEKMEALIA